MVLLLPNNSQCVCLGSDNYIVCGPGRLSTSFKNSRQRLNYDGSMWILGFLRVGILYFHLGSLHAKSKWNGEEKDDGLSSETVFGRPGKHSVKNPLSQREDDFRSTPLETRAILDGNNTDNFVCWWRHSDSVRISPREVHHERSKLRWEETRGEMRSKIIMEIKTIPLIKKYTTRKEMRCYLIGFGIISREHLQNTPKFVVSQVCGLALLSLK